MIDLSTELSRVDNKQEYNVMRERLYIIMIIMTIVDILQLHANG